MSRGYTSTGCCPNCGRTLRTVNVDHAEYTCACSPWMITPPAPKPSVECIAAYEKAAVEYEARLEAERERERHIKALRYSRPGWCPRAETIPWYCFDDRGQTNCFGRQYMVDACSESRLVNTRKDGGRRP